MANFDRNTFFNLSASPSPSPSPTPTPSEKSKLLEEFKKFKDALAKIIKDKKNRPKQLENQAIEEIKNFKTFVNDSNINQNKKDDIIKDLNKLSIDFQNLKKNIEKLKVNVDVAEKAIKKIIDNVKNFHI